MNILSFRNTSLLRHLAVLAASSGLLISAHAVEYTTLVSDKSELSFISKQMGVAVDGKFKRFSGQLSFDPAKPQLAKATLDIDLASIDAGSADANGEVVGKAWFNVRQYPSAQFIASSVKPLGGNRFEISGTMQIKGKTRPVTTQATLRESTGVAQFDGAFVLKRLDFGIGEGMWGDTSVVADEVKIQYKLIARPAR